MVSRQSVTRQNISCSVVSRYMFTLLNSTHSLSLVPLIIAFIYMTSLIRLIGIFSRHRIMLLGTTQIPFIFDIHMADIDSLNTSGGQVGGQNGCSGAQSHDDQLIGAHFFNLL